MWVSVAGQVWRRRPGALERTAARLLRSPGLARALLTTPSLLLPWLIASVVVLAAGAAATLSSGQPLVALLAPAVAAAAIAYSYGPGVDPAWELACSMAVSDRMVLLARALAVFAVNAVLGLAASAVTESGAAAAVTFGWLIPMTAVCAFALAVATVARSAERRGGGGGGRLADHRAVRPGGQRAVLRRRHRHGPVPALPGDRRGLRRDRPVRHADPERNPLMNVEITDLTRRFGRHQAVAGVNLETGPGVFGLLGPNGAGKTTLLRMMATVIPPTTGRLRLLGRDPGGYGPRREVRRRLGYLPQSLGYYPGFTVAEFVEYFALLKEMPSARVPGAVATAIERVDLGGRARAKLRTLSGGMLRRVGIAQAIVNEPELLLLDEPTAGLDPEQRVHFRALLRDLGQRATVVVSTHLVEDVGAACSQVALMDQGKIVFQGTPAELTARGDRAGHRGRPAGARLHRRARGGPVMTAASAPAGTARRPGRRGAAARRGPAAAAGAAAQRDVVAAAAGRRAVLVQRLPRGHGAAADVEPARHDLQNRLLLDLVIPATGAAAWMGSREGRRDMTDLLGVTARPRWSRQLATWAATTAWAESAAWAASRWSTS